MKIHGCGVAVVAIDSAGHRSQILLPAENPSIVAALDLQENRVAVAQHLQIRRAKPGLADPAGFARDDATQPTCVCIHIAYPTAFPATCDGILRDGSFANAPPFAVEAGTAAEQQEREACTSGEMATPARRRLSSDW